MRFSNRLRAVSIAAPCSANWDEMFGNERVRFCAQCDLNVYNLSAMSRQEAESLITSTEGRLCVRFFRRKDGSILTDNCPVGLRALKRRMSRIKQSIVAAVFGCLAGIGAHLGFESLKQVVFQPTHLMGAIAIRENPTLIVPKSEPVMGKAMIRLRRRSYP